MTDRSPLESLVEPRDARDGYPMSFWGPPRQCHLCQQLFAPEDQVFRTVGDVFPEGDPCCGFYFVDLHWDCYARWPHQARFAAVLFTRACQQADETPFWGTSVRTERVLITINPHQHAERIDVAVARTGAIYLIKSSEWSRWLEAPPATHPFERGALEEALSPYRTTLTTPDRLEACAVWPGREKALARLCHQAEERRLQRQGYRLARRRAEAAAREGLACPACGEVRRDHVFHDGASRRRPSHFVCAACGNNFPATLPGGSQEARPPTTSAKPRPHDRNPPVNMCYLRSSGRPADRRDRPLGDLVFGGQLPLPGLRRSPRGRQHRTPRSATAASAAGCRGRTRAAGGRERGASVASDPAAEGVAEPDDAGGDDTTEGNARRGVES